MFNLKNLLLVATGFGLGYVVRDMQEDPEVKKASQDLKDALVDLKDTLASKAEEKADDVKEKAEDVQSDEPDTPGPHAE